MGHFDCLQSRQRETPIGRHRRRDIGTRLAAAILLAPIVAFTGLPARSARADAFPSHSIRLVVAAPPGGTTDILARVVADELLHSTHQPIIVDDKGAGAGNVAASVVAKSSPDGYTLLVAPARNLVVNGFLMENMPYDMEHDFVPVAELGAVSIILVANKKSGIHTVAELISRARQSPGRLSNGSQGDGSSGQLTMELFKEAAKVSLTHVPYPGSAPAMTALLSGEIDVMFDNAPTVLPQVLEKTIVPLGVASRTRIPQIPDVPTIAEQGLPGFESSTWFGVVAPAKTPREVVVRLNKFINDAQRSPQVRKRATDLGIELSDTTPDQFSKFLQAESLKWKHVIQISGLKIK